MARVDYPEYFSKIEQKFQKCKKSSTPLPPLDWSLVEAWFNRGIPLYIVLEVIEEGFAKIDQSRRRKITSLRYFQDEIRHRFEEYTRSNLKQSSGLGPSDFSFVLSSLENKIAQLEEVLKTCRDWSLGKELKKVYQRLTSLKREVEMKLKSESKSKKLSNDSSPVFQSESILDYVEYELEKLDLKVTEFLLGLDDTRIKPCREKVEREMTKYKGKMNQEAYRQTFNLLIVKVMRDEYNLPKLSLFEL